MTHTNLDFIALHTADLDAARHYFTEILGFDLTDDERPGAAVFRHVGGAILAVRLPRPAEPQQPPFGAGVSVWFGVPDIAAYHAQLAERGVPGLNAPTPGPFGSMFSLQTPDGHGLTFHETSSP